MRGPGDPVLHVVRSHRWFWKPYVSLHGHDDTITLQWLRFHARLWRGSPTPVDPRWCYALIPYTTVSGRESVRRCVKPKPCPDHGMCTCATWDDSGGLDHVHCNHEGKCCHCPCEGKE